MPLYDYVCLDCKTRFDVFMTYAEYGSRSVTCTSCRSANVRRRVPRVRVAKSDDSRMDSLAGDFSDPSALAGLENDPQAMGRMLRKMGNEMGEDLPPEFDDVADRLEKGQSPEDIEKELPDLGMDDAGGGEPDF
ncbi:MAG: zinc ribbon domain-containing protein [Anaerolineales bacterium]